MKGVVYLVRENADGDRRIVRTIDVEGLPAETDVMAVVRSAAQEALVEAAAFRVDAMHDDGFTSRLIHREQV